MKSYLVVSSKSWGKDLFERLKRQHSNSNWFFISDKHNFNLKNLNKINPELVFIPHWSYIIKPEIFTKFECVCFHETDLPFGRGGSPIQNLISRNYTSTKISAIKIDEGIDTGDVYLKKELNLNGTAEEIFLRASGIIEDMIIEIIEKELIPIPQIGTPTVFKRRTPEMGNIQDLDSIEEMYNYIRMLDAEGYPRAFIETKNFKIEFSRATLKRGKKIIADVTIIEK